MRGILEELIPPSALDAAMERGRMLAAREPGDLSAALAGPAIAISVAAAIIKVDAREGETDRAANCIVDAVLAYYDPHICGDGCELTRQPTRDEISEARRSFSARFAVAMRRPLAGLAMDVP